MLISNENTSKETKGTVNSQNGGTPPNDRANRNNLYLDSHIEIIGINCLYTNADSLMNTREELISVINHYSSDIVAVSETLSKNANSGGLRLGLKITDSQNRHSGSKILIILR